MSTQTRLWSCLTTNTDRQRSLSLRSLVVRIWFVERFDSEFEGGVTDARRYFLLRRLQSAFLVATPVARSVLVNRMPNNPYPVATAFYGVVLLI